MTIETVVCLHYWIENTEPGTRNTVHRIQNSTVTAASSMWPESQSPWLDLHSSRHEDQAEAPKDICVLPERELSCSPQPIQQAERQLPSHHNTGRWPSGPSLWATFITITSLCVCVCVCRHHNGDDITVQRSPWKHQRMREGRSPEDRGGRLRYPVSLKSY